MLKHYKFFLAFENSEYSNYTSEKLWRGLYAGAVPIVFGAPNTREYMPHDDAVVMVADFASIAALADYIRRASADETLYARHHAWRTQPHWKPRFHAALSSGRQRLICNVCDYAAFHPKNAHLFASGASSSSYAPSLTGSRSSPPSPTPPVPLLAAASSSPRTPAFVPLRTPSPLGILPCSADGTISAPVGITIVQADNRLKVDLPPACVHMARSNRAYAATHGYPLVQQFGQRRDNVPPYWLKVFLLRDLMRTATTAWLAWVDSDASFHHPNCPIDAMLSRFPSGFSFIGMRDIPTLRGSFNAGVWFIKRSPQGQRILDAWVSAYRPDMWTQDDKGVWSTRDWFGGVAYEQGAFIGRVWPSFARDIFILDRGSMGIIGGMPTNAIGGADTYVVHYVGDFKSAFGDYLRGYHCSTGDCACPAGACNQSPRGRECNPEGYSRLFGAPTGVNLCPPHAPH